MADTCDTIVVIDYGVGNLASVVNMLRRIGAPRRCPPILASSKQPID